MYQEAKWLVTCSIWLWNTNIESPSKVMMDEDYKTMSGNESESMGNVCVEMTGEQFKFYENFTSILEGNIKYKLLYESHRY